MSVRQDPEGSENCCLPIPLYLLPEKKWGVGMAELHRLETIYLVCLDKNEIISKVNKEQQELLKKIQVSLEMC